MDLTLDFCGRPPLKGFSVIQANPPHCCPQKTCDTQTKTLISSSSLYLEFFIPLTYFMLVIGDGMCQILYIKENDSIPNSDWEVNSIIVYIQALGIYSANI